MAQYVFLNGSIVIRAGSGVLVPDGAKQVMITDPGNVIPEGFVGMSMQMELDQVSSCHLVGDFLQPRVEACSVTYAAGEITISPCPVGTSIEVHDVIGRETMAELVVENDTLPTVFTLTDPGNYSVEVTPPAPYLETIKRFVIE